MKIAFFGTGACAKVFLAHLLTRPDCQVVLLATEARDPMARVVVPRDCERQHFDRQSKAALFERFAALAPDVLLSVASPFLFDDAWLSQPALGAFNLHPSALPAYAGFYPFIWSIIEGAPTHGVTIHRMSSRIDGGDIVGQTCFPIEADDTGIKLYMRCVRAAGALAPAFVDGLLADSLAAWPQDIAQRSYYRKQIPFAGRVSFERSALDVERLVRAFTFAPFPSPVGSLRARRADGEDVVIERLSIQVADHVEGVPGTLLRWDDDTVDIACAVGSVRLARCSGQPAARLLRSFEGARIGCQVFVEGEEDGAGVQTVRSA